MKLTLNKMTPAAVPGAVLALLAGLLLLKAVSTLDWRMEHDTPLLHYAAFLMDECGAVPYRDIFETSMPGTFAFHYAVCKLFGYGDFAFRCVDLFMLYVLLAAAYMFMRRFGRFPAAAGIMVFGLLYLAGGQYMSLQRDYIGTLPVALALLFIPARPGKVAGIWRFAAVGFLFGLSALIKPHLAIALPVVFGTIMFFRWNLAKRPVADLFSCLAACMIFFAVPVVIALAWLAAHQALAPFAAMFSDYLPDYCKLTGFHTVISEADRLLYSIEMILHFGGYGVMLLCGLFGVQRVISEDDLPKPVSASFVCVLLCVLAYAVYPALGGKFWFYHYVPFIFFCSLAAGFCFFAWPARPEAGGRGDVFMVLVFLLALTIQLDLPRYVLHLQEDLTSGAEAHAPKEGRVDEMAAWLKERLNPGDTIQPLDWTGGSIHAMLLSRAHLATRYMYDYYFYHNVSSPFIQDLRRSFMVQLREAKPRFIIEVETGKPWVSGLDTTRSFPELEEFVRENYAVSLEGDGYLIHEWVESVEPENSGKSPKISK